MLTSHFRNKCGSLAIEFIGMYLKQQPLTQTQVLRHGYDSLAFEFKEKCECHTHTHTHTHTPLGVDMIVFLTLKQNHKAMYLIVLTLYLFNRVSTCIIIFGQHPKLPRNMMYPFV